MRAAEAGCLRGATLIFMTSAVRSSSTASMQPPCTCLIAHEVEPSGMWVALSPPSGCQQMHAPREKRTAPTTFRLDASQYMRTSKPRSAAPAPCVKPSSP